MQAPLALRCKRLHGAWRQHHLPCGAYRGHGLEVHAVPSGTHLRSSHRMRLASSGDESASDGGGTPRPGPRNQPSSAAPRRRRCEVRCPDLPGPQVASSGIVHSPTARSNELGQLTEQAERCFRSVVNSGTMTRKKRLAAKVAPPQLNRITLDTASTIASVPSSRAWRQAPSSLRHCAGWAQSNWPTASLATGHRQWSVVSRSP